MKRGQRLTQLARDGCGVICCLWKAAVVNCWHWLEWVLFVFQLASLRAWLLEHNHVRLRTKQDPLPSFFGDWDSRVGCKHRGTHAFLDDWESFKDLGLLTRWLVEVVSDARPFLKHGCGVVQPGLIKTLMELSSCLLKESAVHLSSLFHVKVLEVRVFKFGWLLVKHWEFAI